MRSIVQDILKESNKILGNFTDKQIERYYLQSQLAKEESKYTCEYCGKDNLDYRNYKQTHSDRCKWSHITKKMILDAQFKFDTANQIWESLDITRKKYVELCNHFGIEFKSADLDTIKQVSSNFNSKKLNVWKYDSTKEDGKGEFLGSFKSVSLASNELKLSRVYIDDCIKKRYPNAKPKYVFEKQTKHNLDA